MTYNSTYTGPQIDKAARIASITFDDIAAMLADSLDYTAHTAGDVFWTAEEDFRYRVAASDATDHHLTTAGGVKLYVLPGADGVYNFKAFNPAADGTTDDYAKLVLALGAQAVVGNPTSFVNGPTLFFPAASYKFNTTINLKSVCALIGQHPGLGNANFPQFIFPADVTGIIINRANTTGQTPTAVTSTTGADGTVIRGINIFAPGTGTDPAAHGIFLRARARIEDCWIQQFSGDGIRIDADFDGGSRPIGNANLFFLQQVKVNGCKGNGVHVLGTDVNAGIGIKLDCGQNARWGILDNSYLGCTWIACHAEENGKSNDPAVGTSLCNYGGKTWHCSPMATEAQYVATQPGTNELIWSECLAATGGAPDWTGAEPEGTWKAGGSFAAINPVAFSAFYNCYVEEVQGLVWLAQHCTYHHGIVNSGVAGPGSWLRGRAGENRGKAFRATDKTTTGAVYEAALGGAPNSGAILSATHDGMAETHYLRYTSGNDIAMQSGTGDVAIAWRVTTQATALQAGRGVAQPHLMWMEKFALGAGQSARQQTNGTAAPATGTWARGDIVWNRDPTAAGWAGWICVTAGTPGTWKQFGAIEA